jgi:hypothetical protein
LRRVVSRPRESDDDDDVIGRLDRDHDRVNDAVFVARARE